jgi:putative addiction module killer protein
MYPTQTKEVIYFELSHGKYPFKTWRDGLALKAQLKVDTRLLRVMQGNYGKHRKLKAGVIELKEKRPSYRIYFGEDGPVVVVLVLGGTKTKQDSDIATATRYWEKYKAAKKPGGAHA